MRQSGFTILELAVVMGLLSVFMMFLLQIVFTTTDLFGTNQADQEKSAHLLAAVRPVEEAVKSTIGPTFEERLRAADLSNRFRGAGHDGRKDRPDRRGGHAVGHGRHDRRHYRPGLAVDSGGRGQRGGRR